MFPDKNYDLDQYRSNFITFLKAERKDSFHHHLLCHEDWPPPDDALRLDRLGGPLCLTPLPLHLPLDHPG